MSRFLFILLLLIATDRVVADDVWTLTRGDFTAEAVRVLALDEKGARVVPVSGGDEQFVPIDEFLEIERSVAESADKAFVLYLASGDRLVGAPAGMSDVNVIWKNDALGEVPVPLHDVRVLAGSGQLVEPSVETPGEDQVLLVNGDSISGVISDLQPDTLAIQSGGDVATIPMESVARVRFAAVGAPAAAKEPVQGFRLRLTDGSVVTAAQASLGGESASVRLNGATPRDIPMSRIAGVEQINGPVTWLPSLLPSETVQQPFLETSWPTRMNLTSSGQPIRFGQRTYTHGIGAHSYSRLTYPLDGRFKAFRTQYAIDGNWPYANVTVRIKLDDKVVHEQADFQSGRLNPVIIVELGSAKSLTLEVDYGQTYDVQDRFNWIEPALLRNVPTTQPIQ